MTSRRRFLQIVAGATVAVSGCRQSSNNRSASAAAAEDKSESQRTLPPPHRVVVCTNPQSVVGGVVNAPTIEAMLAAALGRLSPTGNAEDVLRALFAPDDVVAVKVNCLAGPPLSSHVELVAALARRLTETLRIPPDRILVYDRTAAELQAAGFEEHANDFRSVGSDQVGYDREPTVFGQAGSCYSQIVSQMATAIINVPVLKDHDLAGLSAALKNHFGSMHNPNKMHTDHCCPYVADVNSAPHIREKHRLVVCDALWVCYDGGPGYKPETTRAYGGILTSIDPVATDAVGLDIIEKLRREHGLPSLSSLERAPRYLQVAADRDHALGEADLSAIEVCHVSAEEA